MKKGRGWDARKGDLEKIGEREESGRGETRENDRNRERERELQEGWDFDREYLKSIPEAMGTGELEYEIKERDIRRRNIVIRGMKTGVKELKEEIRETIKKYTGWDMYIGSIRAIGGLVVELVAFENKIEIMRRKSGLKKTGIWLEVDLTNREKQVQEWLGRVVDEEWGRGKQARLGFKNALKKKGQCSGVI